MEMKDAHSLPDHNGQGNTVGRQREPIAIIGIGCRLPGDVSSPSELWELMIQKKSAHSRVPRSRYDVDGYYHQDGDRPGSIHSQGGYFIQEDVHNFDNAFFGIHNMEATYMDPQQRKLLEVVYEAFENAGTTLEQLAGSNTGVYVGNFTNDFMVMQYKDAEYFTRYSATGICPAIHANRITHTFDLKGPSFVLDTACSSSLYALHHAVLGLDAHDCDAAIVASANLIQTTEQQLIAVKAGILSPDSYCHTFDESANGYGRAEGVCAIYLKRLSDAVRDGDPIRSVIRGTAVNGNGKTPGIVQPSIDGQEAVIRMAYRRAGLPTDGTDIVEAHGTGTKVGDPMEAEAISRVFRHSSGRPTLVGGVKPTLGHSEAASGLSSIIKMTLALERGVIPATVGVRNVNPRIKTKEWNIEIVTENLPWPETVVRRASVNSFGFGGANSHAILEGFTASPPKATSILTNGYDLNKLANGAIATTPECVPPEAPGGVKLTNGLHVGRSAVPEQNATANDIQFPQPRPQLLTFSARSRHSLKQMTEQLVAYVSSIKNEANLQDLAFTLNRRRSSLAHRGFLLASSTSLQTDLKDAAALLAAETDLSAALPLVFIFTGQGAQWSGMGRELIDQYPVFRKSIEFLDSCLQSVDQHFAPSWKILNALLASDEGSDINSAEKSQPICTAVQVALIDLLRDWNIIPETVIGHSSGEIAAAYTAGFLTARQAILVAYCRGQAMAKSAQNGAMMAVGLGSVDAQKLVDELELGAQLTVACHNSPENSTISGDEDAIEKMLTVLQERKIFSRKLKTGGNAYHSHHMKALGPTYQKMLKDVAAFGKALELSNGLTDDRLENASLPSINRKAPARMISTVTGEAIAAWLATTPGYWKMNLESPVLFEEAIRASAAADGYHFVEVGPHSALELPIKQTITASGTGGNLLYNSALVRGKDSSRTILQLAGSLFLHGHDEINYEAMIKGQYTNPDGQRLEILTDLPPYPWDYTAGVFWFEPRVSKELREQKFPRHDLLGSLVPGGNGVSWLWRNILDVNTVTWLQDHRLGPSIVFPAAAYIAMAIEAACQLAGYKIENCPGIELRNLNLLKTLDLHPDHKPKVELFFQMQEHMLSSVNVSRRWWEFTVVSLSLPSNDSHPTIHVRGLVGIKPCSEAMNREIKLNKDNMEQHATRVWYEKFTKEGLNWGPQFAVMEEIFCDRARYGHYATATVRLLRDNTVGVGKRPQYIAHPIIIDSMLQAAFVATTAGWVRELKATVPVVIDRISVAAPSKLDMDTTKPWSIDSVSERVGFGTVQIDSELHNMQDQVLFRMSGVRCVPYHGNVQTEAPEKRHPLMRTVWKPDYTSFAAGTNTGLSNYINRFVDICNVAGIPINANELRMAGALDLVAHKKSNLKILELGGSLSLTQVILSTLKADSPLRRFETYTKGYFNNEGVLLGSNVLHIEDLNDDYTSKASTIPQDQKFDAVVFGSLPDVLASQLNELLVPGAVVIRMASMPSIASCGITDVKVIRESDDTPSSIALDLVEKESSFQSSQTYNQITLVSRDHTLSDLASKLRDELENYLGFMIPVFALDELSTSSIPPRSIVVSIVEAEKPLLNTMGEQEMQFVKMMTDTASKIIWLTNADLMSCRRPDFALVLGLSRSLMAEQPSLHFAVVDIDRTFSGIDATVANVQNVLHQLIHEPKPDFEFAQKNGNLHVMRWEPEDRLNTTFGVKQDLEIVPMAIQDAGCCRLDIKNAGQMDTIRYLQTDFPTAILGSEELEIEVKSIGINAKDFYVLCGKVDNADVACSCECAGVVRAVGAGVINFRPGDRVVAMGPGSFATYERFPQWAVLKLREDEEFTTMSTIPIAFSTAIYGLKYRANLQPGETVLIHSAAGGVGLAAIQIAKHLGAEIYATVGNETKKQFLVDNFGLDANRIFNSHDSSFLSAILAATDNEGVDVVLNSLTGDLLHSSLEACSRFGRFIEIGKRDITDHGRLDLANFSRDVTFTTFDLRTIYDSKKLGHHALWQKLLTESCAFIRSGMAKPCLPIEIFDASNVTQAFRQFALSTRMGKVVVSFEDGSSTIPVIPKKYKTVFDPTKSYIMVGCLGGLGRSLSRWMMSRGARYFVFLGRSGLTKSAARLLVDDLQRDGATVDVVRADVSRFEDVEQTVQTAAARRPIGGVIQAAMGLSEALWSEMSSQSWHTGIDPKVHGTWLLHNALRKGNRDADLDFFLMTSSVSGTVGTATESNYCSANSFLDAFARYRNSIGLPAVAVGLGMISEVGYLHENPDIEAMLKRKGMHSINEDEFLQIIDLALSNPHLATPTVPAAPVAPAAPTEPAAPTAPAVSATAAAAWCPPHYDTLANSHLLTGIEFIGLKNQQDRDFTGSEHILSDPRASLFAAALGRSNGSSSNDSNGGGMILTSTTGLPEEVTKALLLLVDQQQKLKQSSTTKTTSASASGNNSNDNTEIINNDDPHHTNPSPSPPTAPINNKTNDNNNNNTDLVFEAVRSIVAKKMSSLILLPLEKMRFDQKLSDFGLDSMLAAELRTFIFHQLEVDVPFVTLLDKGTSVNSLSTLITTQLKERTV